MSEQRDDARDRNLERHLAALPNERAPDGWQGRVLAKVDAAARPPRSRALWLAGGALAAAAAVVIVVLVGRGDRIVDERRVVVEAVRAAKVTRRTEGPVVGDTLVARATGQGLVELRAYRSTGPAIARCPGGPACGSDGSIELPLDQRGPIRVIGFYDRPPPPPGADLNVDVDAATTAGSRVVTAAPLSVE